MAPRLSLIKLPFYIEQGPTILEVTLFTMHYLFNFDRSFLSNKTGNRIIFDERISEKIMRYSFWDQEFKIQKCFIKKNNYSINNNNWINSF